MSPTSTSSLRSQQHSLIRQLADCIEAVWHRHLNSHYPMPAELGYVEGRLEGEKLTIENAAIRHPVSKMHLSWQKWERCWIFCIASCFPSGIRPANVWLRLSGGRGQISAAIADLRHLVLIGQCPVSIAVHYMPLPQLNFSSPRELPAWEIFFRILHLYSTQLPEEEDVQAFFDSLCPSDRGETCISGTTG